MNVILPGHTNIKLLAIGRVQKYLPVTLTLIPSILILSAGHVHHTKIIYRELLRGEAEHKKVYVITAFKNAKSRSFKWEKGVAKSKTCSIKSRCEAE